jgi:hypothetical protein
MYKMEFEYAPAMVAARHDNLKDAAAACAISDSTVQQYFPGVARTLCQPGEEASSEQSAPRSTMSYFMFFQQQGCWAWRRVDEHENVIQESHSTFMLYSECVSDARRHGWKGKPFTSILQQKRRT